MMDIMDESRKARDRLKKFIDDVDFEDRDEDLEIVDVCLQNIHYYASMIIQKDGVS